MKGRPQIVLDIAGVLLSNMSLTCCPSEGHLNQFNCSLTSSSIP